MSRVPKFPPTAVIRWFGLFFWVFAFFSVVSGPGRLSTVRSSPPKGIRKGRSFLILPTPVPVWREKLPSPVLPAASRKEGMAGTVLGKLLPRVETRAPIQRALRSPVGWPGSPSRMVEFFWKAVGKRPQPILKFFLVGLQDWKKILYVVLPKASPFWALPAEMGLPLPLRQVNPSGLVLCDHSYCVNQLQ